MRVTGELAMKVREEVRVLEGLAPHRPELQRRYARLYVLAEGSMLRGLTTLPAEWKLAKWNQLLQLARQWDRWFDTSEFTNALDRTSLPEPVDGDPF